MATEGSSTVDIYDADSGPTAVATYGYDVRNEAGGWECRSTILDRDDGEFPSSLVGETAMCVGGGGYDGLSAILVIDGPDGFNSIVGLVFPGDAPPPPELPAAGKTWHAASSLGHAGPVPPSAGGSLLCHHSRGWGGRQAARIAARLGRVR